jgi:hypothetical protein
VLCEKVRVTRRSPKAKQRTTGTRDSVAITAKPRENEGSSTVVSVAEYRKMLGDNKSTDEQILNRLRYLEALCRNVIRGELENYVKETN